MWRRKIDSTFYTLQLLAYPDPLFRLQTWRSREREQEEKEDLAFPDEIDTPLDVAARTRFQRYRGLRSFRTSPWDPYENLPRDYARIFQFEDYKRTERAVRKRADEDGASVEVRFAAFHACQLAFKLYMAAWHKGLCLPEGRAARSCQPQLRCAPDTLRPHAARTQEDGA